MIWILRRGRRLVRGEGEFGGDGFEFVVAEFEDAVGSPVGVEGDEVNVGVGDVGADDFYENAGA